MMTWTDTPLGSALHVNGTLICKLRPLAAGGISAQWCNGMQWDVSDQLKHVKHQRARWFKTMRDAKTAVEAALAEPPHIK